MDPDPAIFVNDLPKMPTKYLVFKKFLLITFRRYMYINFKNKKSQSIHKAVGLGIKVYITFFAW
jgi:hypothetical protein